MLHDLFFDKYLAPYLHLPSSPGAPNPLGAVSTLPQLVYRYITVPHMPAVYGAPAMVGLTSQVWCTYFTIPPYFSSPPIRGTFHFGI